MCHSLSSETDNSILLLQLSPACLFGLLEQRATHRVTLDTKGGIHSVLKIESEMMHTWSRSWSSSLMCWRLLSIESLQRKPSSELSLPRVLLTFLLAYISGMQ